MNKQMLGVECQVASVGCHVSRLIASSPHASRLPSHRLTCHISFFRSIAYAYPL